MFPRAKILFVVHVSINVKLKFPAEQNRPDCSSRYYSNTILIRSNFFKLITLKVPENHCVNTIYTCIFYSLFFVYFKSFVRKNDRLFLKNATQKYAFQYYFEKQSKLSFIVKFRCFKHEKTIIYSNPLFLPVGKKVWSFFSLAILLRRIRPGHAAVKGVNIRSELKPVQHRQVFMIWMIYFFYSQHLSCASFL